MPKQAYTMGIKTIMQARKVLVVANGLAKAKAVKAVVSGPVTPECPGSILQMHPDCILVADEEALSPAVIKPLRHCCAMPPPLMRGRPWQPISVNLFCQRLPYRGSWRAQARLRGCTKESVRIRI